MRRRGPPLSAGAALPASTRRGAAGSERRAAARRVRRSRRAAAVGPAANGTQESKARSAGPPAHTFRFDCASYHGLAGATAAAARTRASAGDRDWK